jgi:uncharacterized protein (DUF2062 family)
LPEPGDEFATTANPDTTIPAATSQPPFRPGVVIPTFDNPRTIAGVIAEASRHGLPVIVVDDGSGPQARDAIDRAVAETGAVLRRHPQNRGKGAALWTGLGAAAELGLSHGITLDGDGQHATQHLKDFVREAADHPDALLLGARDLRAAGAPLGSRIGCANSNFWTLIETGLRLPDTQTGYRCYPVAATLGLWLRTRGFAFEIESLVKAAWAGVPIRSLPITVRYFRGAERVSHLRPVRDFLRIALLNTHLVTLRICLPAPVLAKLVQRHVRELPLGERWREIMTELWLREPGGPGRIALSIGLGLFMGIAPIWGFQIALTLVTAHALGLSKPIAVVASHVSFPLMIPPILYASLVLGRLLLDQRHTEIVATSLELSPTDVPAWLVGSVALAAVTALVGGLLSYVLLRIVGRQRAIRSLG